MPAPLLGRVTLRMNGQTLLTDTGWKLMLDGFTRAAEVGDDYNGFTEKKVVASVEGTVAYSGATDMRALANARDVTILWEGDNGENWVLPHAVQENQVGATTGGGGGKVALKFHSKVAQLLPGS